MSITLLNFQRRVGTSFEFSLFKAFDKLGQKAEGDSAVLDRSLP